MSAKPKNLLRRRALHVYRVELFIFILFQIHQQHQHYMTQERGALKQPVTAEQVQAFYPEADSMSDWDAQHGGQNVLDASGKRLGYVIQTSPEADGVVGFSGPSNSLIAFGADGKIRGVQVLRSEDTKEHTAYVLKDKAFLNTWNGLDEEEARDLVVADGVSGATLTSMAIADGIAVRLGGGEKTQRFPDEINLAEIESHFEGAATMVPLEQRPGMLQVLDAEQQLLGYVARTSPYADHMLGYQGPTDLLIVLSAEEVVRSVSIRSSYDNESYIAYTVEDEYFFNLFQGFALTDIAQLDMVDAGIDGVTGASKTSITSAEALILAAGELLKVRTPPAPRPLLTLALRDYGTLAVLLMGLCIAFTRLKGKKQLRLIFQLVLIVYLGFINADMVSQALLVGWAQNGVAWKVAPALVALTAAALAAPVFTGRNVYCTHLCPFGALQDWTRKIPLRKKLSSKVDKTLRILPGVLLAWVLVVACLHVGVSLVGIEPFDAFVFRIAGWATIAVAVVGLIASAFVTRAYCKYGCPTGMLLNYLRYSADSARFGRRDWVALALALLALGFALLR